MVLNPEHSAQALLHLHARAIRHAEVIVQSHTHARIEAGGRIADWAFADNAVDSDPVTKLRLWVTRKHRPVTLTVSGPNGRGKTVAAAKWVGRMGGMFLRGDALGREDWTGGRVARRAVTATHLVIDDFGSERGRAREHINALISERFDAGRLTLVTTTLPFGSSHEDAGTIMAEYPGSVHSRMSAGFMAIQGVDLRSDAEPDLTGITRALELTRAAETCRRLRSLGKSDRWAATERLSQLLGTKVDAPEVVSKASDLAARRDAATATLDDFAADMVRKATDIADKRGHR